MSDDQDHAAFEDVLAGFRVLGLIMAEVYPLEVANMMFQLGTAAREAGIDLADPAIRRAAMFGAACINTGDAQNVSNVCVTIERIGIELEGGTE